VCTIRQPSQRVVNLDFKHHRRNPFFEHRLLKQLRQLAFRISFELGVPDSHNGIGRLTWGFGPEGKKPAVAGLDVIVSKGGKIKALYTFLDPA
jgi:hypothetical protein